MKKEIEKLISNIFTKKTFDKQTSSNLDEIGFSNPKSAFNNLIVLFEHINFKKLFPELIPKLIIELSESFDPDRGLNNFERFSEKIFDKNYFYTILNNEPRILKALVTLFSGSQLLTDILLADPSIFDWFKKYETLNESKAKDQFNRELWQFLKESGSYNKKLKILRWYKKREYVRIGLRDLSGDVDVLETIKDISSLADVCLQNSYEFCEEELIKKHGVPMYVDADGKRKKVKFAVLGMGKLGGEELNFSSDIDLIYIYSSDEGKTTGVNNGHAGIGSLSNHEFFSKLARIITVAISQITSEGNVFRVDLGLRPEGQSGDIASSIRSCEIYYESWGQTWERQALIKTRVSAGSEELGKLFDKLRRKFVYRKYLDLQAIDEIREGKIKMDSKLKGMKKQMDVKLGEGGIREIEFIIQVFQLIYGGRDESLQESNTLKALQKVYEKKLMIEEDYLSLVKAYRFLRDIENKIQISFGLQSHSIPTAIEDQAVLAKKMGIKEENRDDAAKIILEEYRFHTQKVHNAFSDLFKPEKNSKKGFFQTVPSGESKTVPFLDIEKYPFKNKQRVRKNLQLLEQGKTFSHTSARSQSVFERLIPEIIQIASCQSDPDEAINNLEKFIHSLKSREIFFDLLTENTKLLKLLLVLFGNSGFLSNILIRQPDLLDSLLDLENIYRFKPGEKIDMELKKILQGKEGINEIKDVLRKFKKGEELRIGLRFLLKEASLENTFADLSLLAEIHLSNSLEIARKELAGNYGKPIVKDSNNLFHECGFAIIGMGKFGGEELDFGSDLDVIFVYEREGQTEGAKRQQIQNQDYFTKLIMIIYDLSSSITSAGFVYKIDTDLRPEGKKGILALPLSSFKKYLEERSRLWERQSLTRARFIAGSEDLGRKFVKIAHEFVYEKRFEYGAPAEIHRLRVKMEKELAKETGKVKDAKVGYGGLVDIEFVVQMLQLKFGGKFKALRHTKTIDTLEEAVRIGILAPGYSNQLKESYNFLKKVINGIRIEQERSENKLPQSDEKLSKLAFKLGYDSKDEEKNREDLFKDYLFHTRQVRGIYNSFFVVEG